MKTTLLLSGSAAASFLVGIISAQSQSNNPPAWRFPVTGYVFASPAVADDGTIYVAATSQHGTSLLYAISPSGVEQWRFPIDCDVYWSSPAVGPDGTIYLGDNAGDCMAFTSTGQMRWTVPTGQPGQFRIVGEPAVGVDGTIYFASIPQTTNWPSFPDGPEQLFAFSPDGRTNWMVSLEPSSAFGHHVSSPAIGPDGSIYIGCSSNLYCVSTEGAVKWRHQLLGMTLASAAFGPDGTVYIGSDYGKFYAVSPEGERKWTYSASPTSGVESSAAIGADGTIRIANWGAPALHALSAAGELLWETGYDTTTSSPALDNLGNVYILFFSSGFFCIDSVSPRVLWQSFQGGQISESSPVITSNGTALVGIANYLFAFNAGHPLMQSSWPMHRHDAKRTARAVQRGLKLLGVQANGDVNLELRVEPGRPYVVQSSANTVDWSDEISLTPDTWKKQLTLPGISGPRFFRLRTTLD